MHTLGHDFVPPPIHAGGLRYQGVAPLISQFLRGWLVRAEAYRQNEVFASALTFAGQRHFDMSACDKYLAGTLEDVTLDEGGRARALQAIEGLPAPA